MSDREKVAVENDVVAFVPPNTGANEMWLTDDSNPDVGIPVALYMASHESGELTRHESGQVEREAVPSMLFRFRPTTLQRGKIAMGEDLYLLMVLPNGRAPLPIELQVGPGNLQQKSALVETEGDCASGAIRIVPAAEMPAAVEDIHRHMRRRNEFD